ncbi:SGNH/GDSL hydrolase family protein [Photobacterium sp. SDRW27]|uniref:SGNH/GDSL hydrolase family protein n=1 Tax=Photobacterium obscurum TaxID=2829490 RepID=UPI00224335FC|nr:SGNH/GDSL hydrolase family protein [Photobacterium obscurum]MCW8329885.1 SGNH/GDSL hydrolase family protein [Photobacterium obscurum]
MLHHLALLFLAPVFIAQGHYVRKITPKLEEAVGPRQGRVGQGKQLRILLLGDSAAAGVGAESQSQALSGQLVRALCDHFELEWQLLAQSGLTTKDTRQKLAQHPKQPYDVVIVSLGVNDVTQPLSSLSWIQQQKALISQIRQHFSCHQIILTKIPPMEKFPALPHPLRWYLGSKAKTFNHQLSRWTATQTDCELVEINHQLSADHMASDGFHPGPAIYQCWGKTIARVIHSRWS